MPCCACIFLTLLVTKGHLSAQIPPTVQQDQFRSQWVGQQVDQIPSGGIFPPIGGLGSIVGSLQTPEQVQQEVAASLAGLNAPPPIQVHPSLSLGWQIANQGAQSGYGTNSSSVQSSAFAAPSLALGYNRDHGPWTISAAYSAGYRYNFNQGYTGTGTGSAQNPLSQTAMASAVLEMSRYHVNTVVTASSGSGYDTTSASFNLQTSISAALNTKYVLTEDISLAADAGYSAQISSQSAATPNNKTSSAFADFSEIYQLTGKTHLSLISSAGRSYQGLQQGTTVPGSASLPNSQNVARDYGQGLLRVDYLLSEKMVFNFGVGVRYVSSSESNSQDTGLKPAWTLGLGYTPTPKLSFNLSSGLQATDVVPEFSLGVSWQPRTKTQVSLAVSQSEQFANSVSNQYIVSRSLSGTISELFLSNVNLSVTGGFATQEYTNLSNQSAFGQSTSQLPSRYSFATMSIFWRINDWTSLVNSLTANTGQQQTRNGGGSQPQYLYSISLNFAL